MHTVPRKTDVTERKKCHWVKTRHQPQNVNFLIDSFQIRGFWETGSQLSQST